MYNSIIEFIEKDTTKIEKSTKSVSYTHLDVYKRQLLNISKTGEKLPPME